MANEDLQATSLVSIPSTIRQINTFENVPFLVLYFPWDVMVNANAIPSLLED